MAATFETWVPNSDHKTNPGEVSDEKSVNNNDGDGSSDQAPQVPAKDWSDAEEKQLVRRLDSIVMPLLMLAFMALQFDRGNIGNTLTDHFLADVGISQYQFNIGQQLLSAGIVVLEIPSNLVLYRIGPSIWITFQIFAWGLVALFQAFQKGLGAYLTTRLLLGLCESGFIPAGLYSITIWYKREETSKRFAWFFIGNMLAQALTGLIAYGVLQMRGIAGLTGWQWLFIIEGLFTILVSLTFGALFPGQPHNPISLLRISYFSERERHILQNRILHDDPNKGSKKKSISGRKVLETVSNWRIYPHLILTICALAPSSTLWSYAPTMVASFGYPALRSNALVSVGCWILLITNISSGWIADKTGRRGWVVLGGLLIWWGFTLGCLLVTRSNDKTKRYALLTLAIAFSSPWHPVNGSWLALNARTPEERSITMAMFIMSANLSGIVGSQLFQAGDKPRYHRGWTAIIGLVSAAVAIALLQIIQYAITNRSRSGRDGKRSNGEDVGVSDRYVY